jgi:hypothetical protein
MVIAHLRTQIEPAIKTVRITAIPKHGSLCRIQFTAKEQS